VLDTADLEGDGTFVVADVVEFFFEEDYFFVDCFVVGGTFQLVLSNMVVLLPREEINHRHNRLRIGLPQLQPNVVHQEHEDLNIRLAKRRQQDLDQADQQI